MSEDAWTQPGRRDDWEGYSALPRLGADVLSRLGDATAEGGLGSAEHRGDLPLGVPLTGEGGAKIERDLGTAAVFPVSLGSADACEDAPPDEVALVGGEGSQKVEQ